MKGNQLSLNNMEIKTKISNVLHSLQFCGLCLEKDQLVDLGYSVEVNDNGTQFKITALEILNELFHYELGSVLCNKHICEKCLDLSISSYVFVKSTKITSKIIYKYFTELDSKTSTLLKGNIISETSSSTAFIVLEGPKTEKKENCVDLNLDYNNDFIYTEGADSTSIRKDKRKKFFVCDGCKKKFYTKANLLNHFSKGLCNVEIKSERKEKVKKVKLKRKRVKSTLFVKKKITCPDCTDIPCMHDKYLSYFQMTKALIGNNKKGKCADCDNEYFTKGTLILHVNVKHIKLPGSFICDECGTAHINKYRLEAHKLSKHQVVRFECSFCDKKFNNDDELSKHIVECEKEDRPLKCDHCTASFHSGNAYAVHRKRHNLDIYYCDQCPKTFTTKIGLIVHQGTHKASKPRNYMVCYVCDFRVPTIKKLQNHMLEQHGKEEYGCKACSIKCDNVRQYLLHTKHSNHLRNVKQEKIYFCTYCDYAATFIHTLERHVNSIHLTGQETKCDICGKSYLTRYQMLKHRSTTHLNKQEFNCEICGATLRCRPALKKHVRLHTGERPYPCTFCEDSFLSASHRAVHIEKIHIRKDIECPLCGMKFYSRRNCRTHIKRVHWKRLEPFDYTLFNNEQVNDIFADRRLCINLAFKDICKL